MCNCRICQRHRKFSRILKAVKKHKHIHKFLNSIFEELYYYEDNSNYYEAILSGDWTNSVEILTSALKKAKKKRDK
jgi:hypothetical protein